MDAPLQQGTSLIAVIALILSVGSLLIMSIMLIRQTKLLDRYKTLLTGPAQRDLETLLLAQDGRANDLDRRLAEVTARVSALTTNAQLHIQKSATVRFNAFPDTGSDLSFAIALLDANNNGLVLSSLYGRSESRVYAKPIKDGCSSYALSEEEKSAIARAIAQTEQGA